MKSITIETSEDEEKAARDATQPYRQFINRNPPLLSLLYDIDLMPEQIVLAVNANRMIAVVELFKRVSPESIKEMFGQRHG